MAGFRSARRMALAAFALALALCLAVPGAALAMPLPGAISGVVHDAAGVNPIGGVHISLYDATSSVTPTASAISAGDGSYAFPNLKARNYYMMLTSSAPYYWAPTTYNGHPSYFGAEIGDAIAVSSGATTSLDPTMTPAAVVKGVFHRKGHPETPIEGAQLQLTWMGEQPDRASLISAETGDKGRYELDGLYPGYWAFWGHMSDPVSALYGPGAWMGEFHTLASGTTSTIDIELPLKPVTVSNVTPGWHKAPFTFQLTVADGDLPPFTPHIYMGPHALDADLSALRFDSDTSQTVWFWSRDASGNVEPTKSVNVQVDATEPETTCTAVPGTVVPTLVLSASDELSGVGSTYYSIDGRPPYRYTSPAAMPGGAHTIIYWSVDAVGNVELGHALAVINPPSVVLGKPNTPSKLKKNKAFSVWGTISPKQAKGDRTTRLYCYLSVHGSWILKKTVWTTSRIVKGASQYAASAKLPSSGSWKLTAYSSGAYCHEWPGWSTPKFVTVK